MPVDGEALESDFVCVCLCLHVCTNVQVACVWKPEYSLECPFPEVLPTFFCKMWSVIDIEVTRVGSLAGQWAPEIPVSVSYQCWD